jgi:hypothetical protein
MAKKKTIKTQLQSTQHAIVSNTLLTHVMCIKIENATYQ